MRQIIMVDDWSEIDLAELLPYMVPDSGFFVSEPSAACMQMWDEPVSEARN